MILADFSQHQNKREINKHYKKIKPQKIQHQQHLYGSSGQQNLINKQKGVKQYINDLGIQNVGEFYQRQNKQKVDQLKRTQNDYKQMKIQESVERLYSTNKNTKTNKQKLNKQNHHSEQEQKHEENNNQSDNQPSPNKKSNKPLYNQLYEPEHEYGLRYQMRNIQKTYKKSIHNMNKKYQLRFKQEINQEHRLIKIKNINTNAILNTINSKNFINSITRFICSNINQQNQPFIQQDKILKQYEKYILSLNYHQLSQPPINNKLIQQEYIASLKQNAQKYTFIYTFLNFHLLKQAFEDDKLKNIQQLESFISLNHSKQKNWKLIHQVFQFKFNHFTLTIPFQTKLYQIKKVITHSLSEQKVQHIHISKFKANPIPSSTYQKPIQTVVSAKKPTTNPVPFNFAQTHTQKILTSDEMYNWNRNFKAKSVPKFIYKAPNSKTSQKQKLYHKKQHQQHLLKTAQYPKTMQYLQNYGQFKQQMRKTLQQKIIKHKHKQQHKIKTKPIPDFNAIHKREMRKLQTRKQLNFTKTEPIPFKFAQTRRSVSKNMDKNILNMFNSGNSPNRPKKKVVADDYMMPQAKSTAKFQAYVEMRKKQKQEKKQQHIEQQLMKKRKQEDMKQYKQILKKRMRKQLQNQPKSTQYAGGAQNNNGNVFKVNLQEIYIQRPLLIEGSHKNTNKKLKDDQKTCFTDGFQPII